MSLYYNITMNTYMEFSPEISIALVGCVSTGKTTLLNALFLNKYSDMKIKRTTMLPQVYHEIRTTTKVLKTAKMINQETSAINNEIIKKTENGDNLEYKDCKQIDFYVQPIEHMNVLRKGVKFAVYDIPGLNDVRTKSTYFEWMKNNFYKFDIIVFVIDVMSAINSSDEMDILNMLCENTSLMFRKHAKLIKMINVVNKCDNMTFDGINPIPAEDYDDLFAQVTTTIKQKYEEYKIMDICTNDKNPIVIPMCTKDAFIYRMLKNNQSFISEITDDQISTIGVNAIGKRFLKDFKTKVYRRKAVEKILSEDLATADDSILMSGFGQFQNILKSLLEDAQQYDIVCRNMALELGMLDSMTFDNYADILMKYDVLCGNVQKMEIVFKVSSSRSLLNTFTATIKNKIRTFCDSILSTYDETMLPDKIIACYDFISKFSKQLQNTIFYDVVKPDIEQTFEMCRRRIISLYTTKYINDVTFDIKLFEIMTNNMSNATCDIYKSSKLLLNNTNVKIPIDICELGELMIYIKECYVANLIDSVSLQYILCQLLVRTYQSPSWTNVDMLSSYSNLCELSRGLTLKSITAITLYAEQLISLKGNIIDIGVENWIDGERVNKCLEQCFIDCISICEPTHDDASTNSIRIICTKKKNTDSDVDTPVKHSD